MENFRTMLRAMWWERLRAKMNEAKPKLKPKDVASTVGMDRQLLYDYLKGRVKNPRGEMLAKLAKAVGTTEHYLRFGDIPLATLEMQVVPLLSLDSISAFNAATPTISSFQAHTVRLTQ